MKKILITITLVLFSSSAFAGSCLKLVGKIDEKMQQAMELRDAGKKAHEEGDHAKSEELLIKALNFFIIIFMTILSSYVFIEIIDLV